MARTISGDTGVSSVTQPGGVPRSYEDKLRETVSVKDFGAVGDSNGTTGNGTDDTAAFQTAIDYVKATGGAYTLYVPEGIYRLTSQVLVDTAVRIVGDGVSPYAGVIGTVGGGSWLYFDHSGKGLTIDGAATMSGISLEAFGTLRNQPVPAPAWAPNTHDYDVYIDNADVSIANVVLLNPTKGVKLTNGSYGRLYLNRLRMQAFQIGIDIEEAYDVVYMDQVHIWPFWKDDTNVHTYTLANLDAIKLGRCDNPMLSNIFTIYANRGLRLYQAAAGKTSKLHLVNGDFDRGKTGILIDAIDASGQLTNITIQGETGVSGSRGVAFEGSGNRLDFANLDINNTSQQALAVTAGTGHEARVTNFVALSYNQSAIGFPAVESSAGNTVRLSEVPRISGGGSGPYFSGAGAIYSPLAKGTTSANTDASGDVVVTHGGGSNPNRIFVQHKNNTPLFWSVRDKTATNFTVRFWTSSGSVLSSTSVAFDWCVEF